MLVWWLWQACADGRAVFRSHKKVKTAFIGRRRVISAALNRSGFTLIELLVTVAIIAVLASLALSAVGHGNDAARRVKCIAQMRSLGTALLLYTQEHNGTFPRSSHSAYANAEPGWQRELLPYLGQPGKLTNMEFEMAKRTFYHCPSDKVASHGTYALNVFFELNPDYDDYEGNPQTWRRLVLVPRPGRTLLFAEISTQSSADHIMAHFWQGNTGTFEVASAQHQGKSNYAFVDGHVETLSLPETYDPASNVNLWNPSLAR